VAPFWSCLSQSIPSSSPINCCSAHLWCNHYLVSFLSLGWVLLLLFILFAAYCRARTVFYTATRFRVLLVFVLHFGQRLWFMFLPGHWFSWPTRFFWHNLSGNQSLPASLFTFYTNASPWLCLCLLILALCRRSLDSSLHHYLCLRFLA